MSIRPIITIVLLLLGLPACSTASGPTEAGVMPYGLWAWQAPSVPTQVNIELNEIDGGWRAAVNGVTLDANASSQVVSFAMPDGDTFSGAFTADRASIEGYWIQPSTEFGYSEMATRVSLRRGDHAVWRANFNEQARPFRVFLNVYQIDGEGDFAVIRNPERNEIQSATRFDASLDPEGDIVLSARRGDQQISLRVEKHADGTLLLPFSRFADPLRLERASEDQSRAFFSRPLAVQDVGYAVPGTLQDGWPVASAREAGFNPEKLDDLVRELAATDPRDRRPRMIHSILISRGGKLVLEEYFHGYNRETPHDIRSLGKVFSSVLIGALLSDGEDISMVDRPLSRILSSAEIALDDVRKADITLDQILTYTTGLDCDDNRDSPGEEGRLWSNGADLGFWTYAAALPQLHDPGSVYAYCSAGINMAGFAIQETAREPLLDTIHRLIAEPLQFSDYHWNLMPGGEAYLGGGAYLKPRDILKIGEVHSSGGLWQGRRILPEDWVAASTTPRTDISPETTGMTEETFSNAYFPGQQAYAWRVNEILVGERSYTSYEATGNGGQIVLVVPELELSVVFTGGNYFMGFIWGRWRDEIVGQHIIPAIEDAQ